MSNLIECTGCGELLEPNFNFCPYCGTKIKKENTRVSSSSKKEFKSNKQVKEFSGTKLFTVVAVLLIFGLVLIFSSGIFDKPKVSVNPNTLPNDEIHRGINLENIQQINSLEEELKANPSDKSKLLTLAHLLNDSGFKEKAIERYKEYLKIDPKSPDVLVDMGVCYYDLGNYEEALKYMKDALKYEPKHQIAHLNIGVVLMATGKKNDAKEWWKKAFEINPNNEIGKRAQELINSH